MQGRQGQQTLAVQYLANVVATGSGHGLVDQLLAHNAGEGVLHTSQQSSLRHKGGGERRKDGE